MSQEWTTRPERSNVWAIRLMAWIALTFGRKATRLLLYPISLYFFLFSIQARAASRKYLDRALGRRAQPADGLRHCFCFAATVLDRVYLLNDQTQLFDLRLHGEKIFDDIKARGRGCLLLGAHLGSFEVIHTLGRMHDLPRTSMVMYEENARMISSVLAAINPRNNPPVIPLGKITSMLMIQEALQRGEFVGILADRTISGARMVACDFLGGQIDLPATPFRLAAMLDCPVVLMLGLYDGGNRYNVHFEYLIDRVHKLKGDREQAIHEAAQHFAARLEHYCKAAPYNWFNFYDIWKK